MQIKDICCSTQVEVYILDIDNGYVSFKPTPITTKICILYHDTDKTTLIGWKEGSLIKHGISVSDARSLNINIRYLDMKDCDYVMWVDNHLPVHETIACSEVKAAPLPCAHCGNFYDYALPNRCGGTKLVCWSCRQGWLPDELRS